MKKKEDYYKYHDKEDEKLMLSFFKKNKDFCEKNLLLDGKGQISLFGYPFAEQDLKDLRDVINSKGNRFSIEDVLEIINKKYFNMKYNEIRNKLRRVSKKDNRTIAKRFFELNRSIFVSDIPFTSPSGKEGTYILFLQHFLKEEKGQRLLKNEVWKLIRDEMTEVKKSKLLTPRSFGKAGGHGSDYDDDYVEGKKHKRTPISNKLKHQIWRRDNFTCQYCKKTIDEVELEVDHIKPVKDGGTNIKSNLQTLCFKCNRSKGAK